MKNINLLNAVQKALNSCKGQWPEICLKAGVSYTWLTKMAASQGKTSFNIGMIERVANELIKRKSMSAEDCLEPIKKDKAA